jgi:hypothetical protein
MRLLRVRYSYVHAELFHRIRQAAGLHHLTGHAQIYYVSRLRIRFGLQDYRRLDRYSGKSY